MLRSFVDTNILVYAHDSDEGRRHEIAKQILSDLWQSRSGVLSAQVLQEFYAVATRKLKPPLPRGQARAVVAAYGEWCTVHADAQLVVSASHREDENSISFWDALIVEAAIRAGAGRLLTEDLQSGQKLGPVVVENPFLES